MKKTYGVNMPIAGYVYLEVEAEDKEQAKEAFYSKTSKMLDTHDDIFSHPEIDGFWEFYEKTVSGNVCFLNHTEVDIEELDE